MAAAVLRNIYVYISREDDYYYARSLNANIAYIDIYRASRAGYYKSGYGFADGPASSFA